MEIELIKSDDGTNAIKRDGKLLFCPYMAPIVTQNSLGSVSIQKHICNSGCVQWKTMNDNICLGCSNIVYRFGMFQNG